MTPNMKAVLIHDILAALKRQADQEGKTFEDGDIFLSLCFKTPDELLKIAKAAGVI